jgi:adenine deaminase
MIQSGRLVPFKFYFGAPSCVPSTGFETSGAVLSTADVEDLLKREEIKYLSEVMNYLGVIDRDPIVMSKIALANKYGKKIDGHAPRLKGEMLEKYAAAGISSDHESCDKDEALQKIKSGMKILIREGSAARNFEDIISLIKDYPDMCMFCSDDMHPDDLIKGHINVMVKKALNAGFDLMTVLRCASVNPVLHYGLEVGLLQKGDPADFVVVDNLEDFNILKTYINGEPVAENGKTFLPGVPPDIVNNFSAQEKTPADFAVKKAGEIINVIEAVDGQLFTNSIKEIPMVRDGYVVSDIERDILKLTVVNRYQEAPPAIGFVKNFGIKKGAIATSVAHDSHNILAVGVEDDDICRAVNLIIQNKGCISAVSGDREEILPLPIAGLMSNWDYSHVAEKYSFLNAMAGTLGSGLRAPFITLSFMALLVIPRLKLSDKGLFNGERFELINLFKKETSCADTVVEMEEDAEYKRQLDLFARSSTEKGIELLKIGEIIAGLRKREKFLDIGAGGGDLTIPISQLFGETVMVEPNEKQAAMFRRRCPNIRVFNEFWEKVDLGKQRFDLILCSHVLYYIEEGKWLPAIEKMYHHLEKGGVVAIVLQSPVGEVARFFKQFTHYEVNILALWRQLIQRYGEKAVEVRYFINEIWTENLADMLDIALFLLLDRKFREKKDKIKDYLEAHHKTDNGYRILQDEILLTVRKG